MAFHLSNGKALGLGARLALSVFALVAVVVVVLIVGISYTSTQLVQQRSLAAVQGQVDLINRLVENIDQNVRSRTRVFAQAFENSLKGERQLESDTVEINGKPTPRLTLNGQNLNLNFAPVDAFTEVSGAVATVFAKSGDDFVRVTTSLKNEKGERAIGTLLDRKHPGYSAVLAGQTYVGLATLFGKPYMTQYDPLRNAKGEVIGLSFVGVMFGEQLESVKATIRQMKVGQTGYFYVVDAKPGPNLGKFLVHPSLEGKNLLAQKDQAGWDVVERLVQQKSGTLTYPWTEPGTTEARDKVVAFEHMKYWDWVLVAGTYKDEFAADLQRWILWYALMGLGAVLVISGLIYVMLQRHVIAPVAAVSQVGQALADGDLNVRLQVQRDDEIGRLMGSVNAIGEGLSKLIGRVCENAELVAQTSREMAQGNHELSARTVSQAGAVEQTSAAVEQLTTTVQNNADNASQARVLAHSASLVAEKGGQVVAQMVDTMKGISDSSRRIADIIGVIDGIAFQTNILALNAAVEAARAGEQGRGFAVVASEVRSLAGRSAEAAKEIKQLITASVARVEQGSALADNVGSTMQEVVAGIRRVNDIMSEISSASSEQSAGLAQVGTAIIQVDQTTQQNAALVEHMSAAANHLQQQAKDQVAMVAAFKGAAVPVQRLGQS